MIVQFNDFNQYFLIEEDKEYNYNEEYEKRHLNRVLAKMERFFRKHDLLLPGEMLDITQIPQKHLRLPFIEHIAYRKGWINYNNNDHINIITK